MTDLNSTEVQSIKSNFLNECTNSKLAERVLNQIDDDDSVFAYPNDYRDASAGVSGFIYYSDTVKFAKENLVLITNALNEFESECGVLNKPQEDETQFYNWMAWFALENTISNLIHYLENH